MIISFKYMSLCVVQFTTGFKGPFTPTESRNESEKTYSVIKKNDKNKRKVPLSLVVDGH